MRSDLSFHESLKRPRAFMTKLFLHVGSHSSVPCRPRWDGVRWRSALTWASINALSLLILLMEGTSCSVWVILGLG